METSGNRRKWRNLLILPGFQLRLALGNLIFLIAVVSLFCFVLLLTFYYDVTMADSLWSQYASAEIFLRLLERGAILLLAVTAVSLGYHIAFSHRLCGPLVNMRHTFAALAQGNATRDVHLRRKDFLTTEAQAINEMLAAVRGRIADLKESQAEIDVLARQLPPGPVADRLRERLSEQQRLLDRWVVK